MTEMETTTWFAVCCLPFAVRRLPFARDKSLLAQMNNGEFWLIGGHNLDCLCLKQSVSLQLSEHDSNWNKLQVF